jgi:transcriptional regulator with XRE-family HTH domain
MPYVNSNRTGRGPTRKRPREATITYRGMPWRLNLHACERALVYRQIEGAFETMNDLARLAGCSRSTATRLFRGQRVSIPVLLRILKVLRLKFEDIATPVEEGQWIT